MFAISTSASSAAKNFGWQNKSNFLAIENSEMTKRKYADRVVGIKISSSDDYLSQMTTGRLEALGKLKPQTLTETWIAPY